MLRRSVVLLALLMFAGPAVADDEGSEHTAQLVGASKDTLGVNVSFDAKLGWQMKVRAKPGATEKTITLLPIPKHHAHYVVYVAPGRSAIAFVEISAGTTSKRTALAASDTLAWVFSPDGKLLRSWSYGKVLTKDEIDMPDRSVSHMMWQETHALTKRGLEFKLANSNVTVVLDPAAKKLAR